MSNSSPMSADEAILCREWRKNELPSELDDEPIICKTKLFEEFKIYKLSLHA